MVIKHAQTCSIFIADEKDFFFKFIANCAVKLGSYDEGNLLN